MEERFSRKKHDLKFNHVLDNLQNTYFDKVVIIQHFLDSYTYPIEKVKEKLSNISYKEIVIKKGKHHLYHTYSGFYNSGFDEAICFSVDGCGAILSDGNIELESVYHLKKDSKETLLYQRTREFKTVEDNSSFNKYIASVDYEELSVGEKFCTYSLLYGYNAQDGAGKIMGLAQYKNHKEKLQYPYNSKEWKQKVDEAHDLQQETQTHILDLLQKYTKESGVKNVVISGGYGLNVH